MMWFPAGMPERWLPAIRWVSRMIAERCTISRCCRCQQEGRLHLWCSHCTDSYCRSCLDIDHEGLWDLAFECPGCSIESACKMDGWTEKEEELMDMVMALQRTYALAKRPATWSLYTREFKIVIFPVAEDGNAMGLAFFFQHLKLTGVSWAKMEHYRSALVAASISAGFCDQWKKFQQVANLTTGLLKELRTTVKRKEGFTIAMVIRILDYLDLRFEMYNGTRFQRRADKAVLDKVAIICGFFGMKRGDELWMDKLKQQGLSREMGMKNDTTCNCTEIVMGWVSGSGVKIGEAFQQLEALLDRSNIPLSGPLFCATQNSTNGGFPRPDARLCFRASCLTSCHVCTRNSPTR
eukprot:1398561-Rhodomonas_salina.3